VVVAIFEVLKLTNNMGMAWKKIAGVGEVELPVL